MIERRDCVTRSRESSHGGNDWIVGHIVTHHDDKGNYAYFIDRWSPTRRCQAGKLTSI
jgi:hypothetical protein